MFACARTLGPAAVAAVATLLLGCGAETARPPDAVRPIDPPLRPTTSAQPPDEPVSAAPEGTAPAAGAPTDPTDEVTDALIRYDLALTALSADPLGAATPDSPVRLAWDTAVDPAAPLSTELVERVVTRAQIERVVVLAGPDGSAYHHLVDQVIDVDDGSISFSWCGYSPGIARDVDSGEVVDDTVGHATGTGRIAANGDTWTVAALDELDLAILPPGSTDPC